MINLLYVGLILIISRVFTILCLLFACVGIGNTVVTFKTKQQSAALLPNECPSKVRRKAFLMWTKEAQNYSLNYHLPTYRGNVNYYNIKVFIILFLLCLWGNREHSVNFQNKSVHKLSFQLSFQIYFLLAQTEGERETIFGRVKEGGPHCNIITWLIYVRDEI